MRMSVSDSAVFFSFTFNFSFTFRSVALMKAASLLARKVTAAATSLMSPILLAMWNFPQTGSHFSLPPAPAA